MDIDIPLEKRQSSNKLFTRVFNARDTDYCLVFLAPSEFIEPLNMDLPEYFSKMGSGSGPCWFRNGSNHSKNDFLKYDC